MTVQCHLFLGWHLARHVTTDVRARRWIAWSGVAADLDGVGVLIDIANGGRTNFYEAWHHFAGHNVFVGVFLAAAAGYFCRSPLVALWALISFHVHLAADLISGRGPDGSGWPIVYGWPLSDYEWQWTGQWKLAAWPNTAAFLALLAWALVAIHRSGRSPLELISTRLDRKVLDAFRSVWTSRSRVQTAEPKEKN